MSNLTLYLKEFTVTASITDWGDLFQASTTLLKKLFMISRQNNFLLICMYALKLLSPPIIWRYLRKSFFSIPFNKLKVSINSPLPFIFLRMVHLRDPIVQVPTRKNFFLLASVLSATLQNRLSNTETKPAYYLYHVQPNPMIRNTALFIWLQQFTRICSNFVKHQPS